MTGALGDFTTIGILQATLFRKYNAAYCDMLVEGSARRDIMLICYRQLVREGKIFSIEAQTLKEKEESWQFAKDIAQGRLGKSALIELVQALNALEYFLPLTKN